MKFKLFDLVKVTTTVLAYGAYGDMATIQYISKHGRIALLLETGEWSGHQEEVFEEDIELVARLTDEELEFLKEEM